MDEHEIREIFDLEYQLVQILYKGKWYYPFQDLKIGTVFLTGSDGIIIVNRKESDIKTMRRLIRDSFVFLITGTSKENKYAYQKIAKQLGYIREITAQDACECKWCGQLSPLTHYHECVPCHRISQAIESNPKIARRILKELEK
jgi:hypothetical protein